MSQLPGNKVSEQNVLNWSFDPTYGTLVFQGMGFDGQNLQRSNADNLQIKVVESGSYTYFCFSAPGTAEASALWRIFRLDGSGNLLYADADANYDNVASDPTVLSYSYS